MLIALVVGIAIGYAIGLPERQRLQAEISQLKEASAKLVELQEQVKALSSENEALKKQIAELQEKLTPRYVEKIKARGKLIVGTSADWPPFEYIDEKGNVIGIDIAIAKKIAEALGVELEIKDMKFAALIQALKAGIIDMILADMTPTPEREK